MRRAERRAERARCEGEGDGGEVGLAWRWRQLGEWVWSEMVVAKEGKGAFGEWWCDVVRNERRTERKR